ncbi:hypothetical protein ANCCEY_02515 [Ancylostoma ceylanicum]|uniref:Glycogen [starch] synthase n=1 Tax=Ancylostoma ceylanicum TaxID=53326 RepID=A0A0D6M7H3_9BILA|nr:hypothetical protein ANCCEY_02515 [Ancylostoma ceylanicum]
MNLYLYFEVGGIYTVLRTKAPISTEELGDQYCMLGPYNEDRVKLEVEILEPDNVAMKYALEHVRECGFKFAEAIASTEPLIVAHFHEWQSAAGLIMSR